jgi:hypothetical protein
MTKVQRRVALARRQVTLARVRRLEALASLADALSEENRSAALARKSGELLDAYARRNQAMTGDALRLDASFARSLHDIAQQAEAARTDASQQAQWQLDALAAAETRLNRTEERLDLARKDAEAVRQSREQHAALLAHKLQSKSRKPAGS